MEQHNGTTYENVWGVTFGDRLEEMREELKEEARKEAREEARAEERREGRKRFQTETIRRMIRLGYDDKAIQAAVGITDVNEIIALRKNSDAEI